MSIPDTASGGLTNEVPVWLTALAIVPGLAVASIGMVGLTAALFGVFQGWWVLMVSAPLTAVVAWPLLANGLRSDRKSRSLSPNTSARRQWMAVALLGLVVLVTLVYAKPQSQHVLIDSDPGAYSSVAKLISETGSLVVDDPRAAFGGNPAAVVESPAVYDEPGRLEFQFSHFTSAVLASAESVGGENLMFRLPALMMGAAILAFGVICWICSRGSAWFLLGPALLGASLPYLFVARDTYSENATTLLVMTSLLAVVAAVESSRASSSLSHWVAPGLIIGALIASRPDTIAYIPGLVGVAGAAWVMRRVSLPQLATAVGVALVPALVGLVDLAVFSTGYWESLQRVGGMLRAGVALSVALIVSAVVIWDRNPGLSAWVLKQAARFSVLGGVLVAVFLGVVAARPLFLVSRRGNPSGYLEAIEAAEGLVGDGGRRYTEYSVEWLSWYYGWLPLCIGGIGLVWATVKFLRAELDTRMALTLAVTLPIAFLYLLRPGVTATQLWAMRRFVQSAIPLVALLCVFAIVATVPLIRSKTWAVVAIPIVVAALLAPAVMTTRPLVGLGEQRGYLDSIESACRMVPENAAVLIPGRKDSRLAPQTLRSWCGFPVASASAEDLPSLIEGVSEEYRPVLFALNAGAAAELAQTYGGEVVTGDTAIDEQRPEITVRRKPTGYMPIDNPLYTPTVIQPSFVILPT